ncbi:MAG TPA: VanZ family protein [Puia sp.]|nr:VanZ family protein [Puia sp.]
MMNFSTHIQILLSKIYIPVFWTIVVVFLLCIPGTMLPNEQNFSIPYFDKIVHMILFGMFVFLWCFYLNGRHYNSKRLVLLFFIVFILAEALGIAMEFVQKCCVPFRDFSKGDIIADLLGAGIAYGICNTFLIGENNSQ